ncbi:MAG: N-6 DNA methylase [Anaerolinea sp.]|nr:N-6 DNA methylase [Anaerolinea sp.]
MENPNLEIPYPGPISFSESQRNLFFGREIAIRKLVSFIRSQSVIVLYGKSGTGKTSLLNAGVIPALKRVSKPSAEILGPVRFVRKLPTLDYVTSVLQQLNASSEQSTSGIKLIDWFNAVEEADPRSTQIHKVLIFDQFEEFFTTFPEGWEAREAFFDQLDEVLTQHRNVRVLLVIREDFLGDLFRYSSRLSTGISIRFQLLMLKVNEARDAIAKPANEFQKEFEPEAIDKIIDELRLEQRYRDDKLSNEVIRTEFVSPLLLQLVCTDLWTQLVEQKNKITKEDVEQRIDVNSTVVDFYARMVASVAAERQQNISDLYQWFEDELISGEKRVPAFVRDSRVGTMDREVANAFDLLHLIRREVSADGVEYYELAHDRFVSAIRQAKSRGTSGDDSITSEKTNIPNLVLEGDIDEISDEYRTPDEQISAKRIWSKLAKLISRGRLTTASAIVISSKALDTILRSLDDFEDKSANLLNYEWLRGTQQEKPLAEDEWFDVRDSILYGITEYSVSSVQDVFLWLLNEAASSRPQSFNDIFTPFTVGQLMMGVLSPNYGHVYDPFCHSGELFGYYHREIPPLKDGYPVNYALAVDRYAESQTVTQAVLQFIRLRHDVLTGDALRGKLNRSGQFDYVFSNPPFNDKNVDWWGIPEQLKPFGDSTNSNMAWVQHIYASLKPQGRAAFFMASSLAKSNDRTLRLLLESGSIEAVFDLGQDRFYRGVAVHLWLLNRRTRPPQSAVMFVDMTELGIQRRPRLFTNEHIDKAVNLMARFRSLLDMEDYDTLSQLDEPGFCKVKRLTELLQGEVLDLAPRSHVTVIPRVQPKRDLRELIQEYEALQAQAKQLDTQITDALSRIKRRLS